MTASKRPPSRSKRRSIGVIYNGAGPANHGLIIAGIEARAAGSDIFCFNASACDDIGNRENARNVFFSLVNKRTIDGLVILPGAFRTASEREQRQLYKRFLPLPLVTVEFKLTGVPAVVSNEKKGMQSLINHLVTVHGKKRIAFLAGEAGQPLADSRFALFAAAMKRQGIAVWETLVMRELAHPGSVRRAVHVLLAGKKPACDAIVTADGGTAGDVLDYMIERGLRPGLDCAVAGFETDYSPSALLPLTGVRLPSREMGVKAAETLLALMEGKKPNPKIVLETTLVMRESCGCFQSCAIGDGFSPPGTRAAGSAIPSARRQDEAEDILSLLSSVQKKDRPLLREQLSRVLDTLDRPGHGAAGDSFLTSWNGLLRLLLSLRVDPAEWREILFRFRTGALAGRPDPESRERIETTFLCAAIDTLEKSGCLSRCRDRRERALTDAARAIGEQFRAAPDLAAVKKLLPDTAATLGFQGCYLSLWDGKETPLHYSCLAAAAEHKAGFDPRKHAAPYLTNRLLPPGILRDKEWRTLFIEPLFGEKAFLGLLLIAAQIPSFAVHEILRLSLNGALLTSCRDRETHDVRRNLEAELADQAKKLLEANQRLQKEKRIGEKLKEELVRSEERYNKWFEDDFTGNFIAQANGDITDCNTAFATIFGFPSRKEALGTNFGDFYPNKSALEDFYTLLGVVKSIEYYESEFVRQDGNVIHIIGNIIGTFDPDGNLVEMQGFLFDNTERKQLEEELRQAHKMDAIGRLAGGIAHDFNNILTGIMGYSELLLNKIPASDPSLRDVEEIKKAAKSAASLTRQLLAFSRKQIMKPLILDLNEVVRNMRDLLIRIIGEHIRLVTELEEDLSPVKADRGQIEQVIMNLVLNSRDALPQGGMIVLTTRNKIIESSTEIIGVKDVKSGQYVILEVNDNGVGMDLKTQTRIFEPFFTTKRPGQGVGLGLSTVYGIITQSGGFTEVTSEPHRGTTLRVYLPQYTRLSEAPEEQIAYQEEVRGNQTILLVEDENFVRELAEKVLSGEGYHVLAAHNAQEALSFIKKHSLSFDLVVTDIVMPGISGIELGQKIQAMRPEIKILFMSGYDEKMLSAQGEYTNPDNFIPKPFTPELLLRKVQDVLNR